MEKIDAMLRYILDTAANYDIPVSKKIAPQVMINRRATGRFGACKRIADGFEIEISHRLINASDSACISVLAHEVLHTCHGCMNHGKRWRQYAECLSRAFDVNIKCSVSCAELGIEDISPDQYKYRVICSACGKAVCRRRASRLVTYPENYRCTCGGRLYVENVKK